LVEDLQEQNMLSSRQAENPPILEDFGPES